MLEQIRGHLKRLGLSDLDASASIAAYEDEPGKVRLADDWAEWIGPEEVALERLSACETLSWEEFWDLFRD